MNNKIINRILKQAGNPGLLKSLVNDLSLSDLQSLLLEVYKRKTKKLSPKDLLQQYSQNRFVKPSAIYPLRQMEFEHLACSLLPIDFIIKELSPVAPLGSSSVLAPVDQNNVITAIRNTEVCSDSTNVLALESALIRQKLLSQNAQSTEKVKLCSCHRLVRGQLFDEAAAFGHFKIFSLGVAGRDEGSFNFEIETLKEQIHFYLKLLKICKNSGYNFSKIYVDLIPEMDTIKDKIEGLHKTFSENNSDVSFDIKDKKTAEQNYYSFVRFQMHVSSQSGEKHLIVDGGDKNWSVIKRRDILLAVLAASGFFFYLMTL
jgi:hypothetical protein